MKLSFRVYYDINTGHVIQTTGNFEDKWQTKRDSIDVEIPKYISLSGRIRESFDVLELPFGSYRQDLLECNDYRVNPETKELEFSYPDPNEPEVEQPYQAPLSEEVNELKRENKLLKAQTQANSDRADFQEDLIVEMAMLIYQ